MEKKNNCEIVQDLLLGYVDETLNPESKKFVEGHIKECDNCKKSLQDALEDLSEDEKKQKKEIDYLKKIKTKTRIRSIVIAILIIAIVIVGFFINKFITINSVMVRGSKNLQNQNYYCESQERLGNIVMLTKIYYKDGKYKRTQEVYSNEGIKKFATQYGKVNSDEIIEVNEENNTINIRKGDIEKRLNSEDAIKYDKYRDGERTSFTSNLGKTFQMDIKLQHFRSSQEYYVLKRKYKDTDKCEIHIDKETGLVIKEIYREAEEKFYPQTNVVTQVNDRVITYKYEFGNVKDEDVEVPNLAKYTNNNN